MKRIKFMAPSAILGAGFSEENFRNALTDDIAFIGCDAGSCDGGAVYLGDNRFFQGHSPVKRDLRLMLLGAREKNIPMLIGSCGGSGGNWNLEWVWSIIQEIAAEEKLSFTTALIQAEPDREVLLQKWRDGKIHPLEGAPDVDEDRLRKMDRVVAMMGHEAYLAALEGGADVVLAGRSTDASIFAAIPLREGFDPGLVWHAAKIVECGGACVVGMDRPDGIICTIEDGRFLLEPVSPVGRCTPHSVAAHALYETGDPFRMKEPGGELDLSDAKYEALSDRIVAISGSTFREEPYTVRLEGAELAGFQSMMIGGIRDPVLLKSFDSWFENAKVTIRALVETMFGAVEGRDYQIFYRNYGRDGVLGEREPKRDQIGHEIGMMMTVLTDTQERATSIARYAALKLLHLHVPAWTGSVSNLAYPICPHIAPLGPSFRFALNHVAELDEPLEFFPIRYESVG